jgi:hypothetical protein
MTETRVEQETKRIPFDKARALAGDECVMVLRSGNECKAKVVFDDEEENKLLYVWFGYSWCEGWCDYEGKDDDGVRLYMKPKVQTFWVNVYCEAEGLITVDTARSSEESAKVNISQSLDYVKTISFDVEV